MNFLRFTEPAHLPNPYERVSARYQPWFTDGEEFRQIIPEGFDDATYPGSTRDVVLLYTSDMTSKSGLSSTTHYNTGGDTYWLDININASGIPQGQYQVLVGFGYISFPAGTFDDPALWTITGGDGDDEVTGGRLYLSQAQATSTTTFTATGGIMKFDVSSIIGQATPGFNYNFNFDFGNVVQGEALRLEILDSSGDVVAYFTNPSGDHFADLPAGDYSMRFSSFGTESQILNVRMVDYYRESNCIQLTRNSNILGRTVRLEYRHESNIYGIPYEILPSDYTNQIRLDLYSGGAIYPKEFEQYKEATTGITRNYNPNASREYEVESYYFDEYAHQAMAEALDHSTFKVDGKTYTVKEGYEIERELSMGINKGRFTLIDQAYAMQNKNGAQVV